MCKLLYVMILAIGLFSAQENTQNKPQVLVEVQQSFQKHEPRWKVERRNVQDESGFFKEETVLNAKGVQAATSITIWKEPDNARSVYEGNTVAFGNTAGAKMRKIKLPDLGDENLMWANPGGKGYVMIHVRQANIFYTVFAPSSQVGIRFARRIADAISSAQKPIEP